MNLWRGALSGLAVACITAVVLVGGGVARSQSRQPVAAQQQTGREILVMLRLSPDHYRPTASYGGDYGDQQTGKARRRVAQAIARSHGLVLARDGWPMPLLGLDCYVMGAPDSQTVDAAVAEVAKDSRVAWSEPMHLYAAQGVSSTGADPLYQAQPAARSWRLADLHKVATGRGVTVAVIDSRIDVKHPDLAGQFVANEDFVGRPGGPERHGTGVAGVIAAKANNGIGIMGVAPEARLMALRACWQLNASAASPTYCDTLSLAKALHFAIERNAAIINLSLGGPPDLLLKQLIDVATNRRITVVAAYDPAAPGGGFPASVPGVIAVANESLPSVLGNVYAAPGKDVLTTQPGGKWSLVNGSSYSAAHVSGLVALVREQRRGSMRPILVAARASGGTLDACATVQRATGYRCNRAAIALLAHSAP